MRFKNLKSSLCWLWCAAGAPLALAACGGYQRHTSDPAAEEYAPTLGSGVNYSETKTFRSCINQIEPIAEAPALERLYDETRISSRKELDKTLDLDTTVSARGLWGQAEGGVGYFKNVEMDEDAFYWLVDARYTLSLEKLPTHAAGFDLTDHAKQILKEHGVEAFYEACGTHFYVGRRLGARYTLLYEFNSRDDKVTERLKVKANGSSSAWGLKASAEFSQFVQAAERASILKIHANILGGDHTVEDYARTPDRLPQELEKLRQKLVTEKRGVALEWYVASYDMFSDVIAAKKIAPGISNEDFFRSEALAFYYDHYHHNLTQVKALRALQEHAGGAEPLLVFMPEKMAMLREQEQAFVRQNDEISRRAAECLQLRSDCQTSGLDRLRVDVPEVDKDLRGLGEWQLVPAERSDSKLAVDIVGHPGGDTFKHRVFVTEGRLTDTAAGAVAITKDSDGRARSVVIGSFDSVIDPVTGKRRVGLCVGQYASVCNLRVVENPNRIMADGYPASKLQLTMFNADGFVTERIDFLIQE